MVNMKQILHLLVLVFALHAGVSQGQDFDHFSTSDPNLEIDLFRVSILNLKKGYLETAELAIGTILKSHHFNNDGFNQTHNGLYLSVDRWSLGTYKNSSDVQSSFVTYNSKIYKKKR